MRAIAKYKHTKKIETHSDWCERELEERESKRKGEAMSTLNCNSVILYQTTFQNMSLAIFRDIRTFQLDMFGNTSAYIHNENWGASLYRRNKRF